MNDLIFLSVTNSPYIPIVERLIRSLNHYHPENKIYLVCVNMSEEEISYVKNLHDNLHPIVVNKAFKKMKGSRDNDTALQDTDHEEGYCTSCRSWFMAEIMEQENKSVFYLDADVYLKGTLDELYVEFQSADIMVRSKVLNPKTFKCNAGMVWVKNTPLNRELIDFWVEKTIEMGGTSWRANQWALDEVVRENWNRIVYKDFPIKFDGKSDNPDSLLVHLKGPTQPASINIAPNIKLSYLKNK